MNYTPTVSSILDDKLNGVALWRTVRPWSDLHMVGAVNFKPVYKQFNEQDAFFSDFIYISHAHHETYVKIAEGYKAAGRKVWVDLDDDLMNAPTHNMAKATLDNKSELTKKVIGLADVFTVTTKELADKYSQFAKCKTVVIPNTVWPYELKPEWSNNNRALWRSNISQLRDMWVNWRDCEIIEKTGVAMAYIGAAPPWIDNPPWTPWGPTLTYFDALKKTEAAYFWKPLEDCEFNRCKSNITMLEGAMVGALTICNIKTEQWKPAIQASEVRDRDEAWKRKRYAQMIEFITTHYNSEVAMRVRYELLIEALNLKK
jgi:hypothetical protein